MCQVDSHCISGAPHGSSTNPNSVSNSWAVLESESSVHVCFFQSHRHRQRNLLNDRHNLQQSKLQFQHKNQSVRLERFADLCLRSWKFVDQRVILLDRMQQQQILQLSQVFNSENVLQTHSVSKFSRRCPRRQTPRPREVIPRYPFEIRSAQNSRQQTRSLSSWQLYSQSNGLCVRMSTQSSRSPIRDLRINCRPPARSRCFPSDLVRIPNCACVCSCCFMLLDRNC